MRASLKLLALGSTLAVFSGTGMFALTNDLIESEGNSGATGTYTPAPPAAHDIAATTTGPTSACPSAASSYDSDDLLPAVFTNAPLALSGGTTSQATDFCIKNFGAQPVDIYVGVSDIASREIGSSCEASEVSAGDNSCGSDASGELSTNASADDLQFSVVNVSGNCFGATPVAGASQVLFGQSIGAGETCRFYLAMKINPALTDQQRLVRQTDNALFIIAFTATDGTGPI